VTASHASSTHLYIAHKSGSVVRYDLRTMRLSGNVFGQSAHGQDGKGKEKQPAGQGHKGTIYCLAASEDGKYVVTGGKDKLVGVWEVQPGSGNSVPRRASVSAKKRKTKRKAGEGGVKWLRGLTGHKDAVTVSRTMHVNLNMRF
jgi:ribosomal RNA-processing protein 9